MKRSRSLKQFALTTARVPVSSKTHMNVAAVTSAHMVHAEESRDWPHQCQRARLQLGGSPAPTDEPSLKKFINRAILLPHPLVLPEE